MILALKVNINDDKIYDKITLMSIDGVEVMSFRVHPEDAEKIIEKLEWNKEYIIWDSQT